MRSTLFLVDTGTLGTSGEIYIEDADGEIRSRYPLSTNPVAQPLSYSAQKLLLGKS